MSLVLVTREELEKSSLAHYRTPGSKNGERLYQYKDGSLTPLGRIHYGVGLGRDRSTGGAVSMIVGKKQVNKDGSLTKQGKRTVEETTKDGGFLNPSAKERKSGHAKERDKVAEEFKEETNKLVEDFLKRAEKDPDLKKNFDKDPDLNEQDRKLWEKYQDKYAEATLKDLKLPVNETNKGAVKDALKRLDERYDYDYHRDSYSEESKQHLKEVSDNRDKRFKEERGELSNKEIKKEVKEKIDNFNDKVQTAKEERTEQAKERKQQLKEEIAEIRSLADDDLDKRIARLQKEKQYSELLNQRDKWEQSPLHQMASKLFKDAAENLARKSLNLATDELLKKYRDKMNSSEKKGDEQKNNDNKNDNSKPKDQSGNNGGNGQKFSKAEKSQIRSMAGSGKSVAEIAKALGTTEEKVKNYMSAAGVMIS